MEVRAEATRTALRTSDLPEYPLLTPIDVLLVEGTTVLSAISLNFISFISSAVGNLLNLFFGVTYLAVCGRVFKAALVNFDTAIDFFLISFIFYAVRSAAVSFSGAIDDDWVLVIFAEGLRAATAFLFAFIRF